MSDAEGPDLLSEVLASLQLRTGSLGEFVLTEPWGMVVAPFGPVSFYAVIEGAAHLEVEGEAPVSVREGDIFLVQADKSVTLRSAPGVAAVSVIEAFAGREHWVAGKRMGPLVAEMGGGGATTRFLVALLEFEERDRDAIGLNLPPLVLLRRNDNLISPWLAPAARSIVEEADRGRLGYWAMATRMAELLFINTVRTHLILRPEDASGWLRGAADPRVARALSAVHRNPGSAWTVESLAKAAGMSRSAFADLFQRLLGETPFEYVTRWRMRLARDWMSQGRCSVKAAAHELGYASEKAFSQAFRRVMGAPPSHYRR
jgi:AraC-like DNA-binding protein